MRESYKYRGCDIEVWAQQLTTRGNVGKFAGGFTISRTPLAKEQSISGIRNELQPPETEKAAREHALQVAKEWIDDQWFADGL
ncbi:hypothetical protein O0880_14515 [Janthinobacterium sp. SUN118]|uniref:hypothetical protein n=1 Tax=Janthinobacterium sp. SUN118 TaxID=3004100 RepID=UPI0025B19302|nr:hypothetical protein [Janthinobacterium sp. SUN118]MDN2710635.1 hypothetical protein [Janthinobacterium sp. SUN118]